MAQYTLFYGNARGRGEVIRLVFAAGGQEFDDKRFEFADWPSFKPKAPFGQMPFLEVTEGGKTTTVAQSVSIGNLLSNHSRLFITKGSTFSYSVIWFNFF